MIVFTSILFTTDDYDWRLAALSMIAVVGIHLVLLQVYVKFYYSLLKFARNMPRSWTQIGLMHGFSLLIILTPELIIMLRYYNELITLSQLLLTFAFGTSLAFLMVMLLVQIPSESDQSLRIAFFIIIGLVVIVMYSVPLIWITALILLTGTWFQSKEYKTRPEFTT